jgi:hypothetical protein
VLAAMIAVNVATFVPVEQSSGNRWAAISRYDQGDIIDVGLAHDRRVPVMYGQFLALGELAPDSRVFVDEESRVTRHEFTARFFGYGRVASVEEVRQQTMSDVIAYESERLDPTPYLVASGEGGRDGPPWAIAMASRPGPGREFVLLEWVSPVTGSAENLLLETRLLTEETRRELVS